MNSEIKNKPSIEEREVALQIDFVRMFEKRMQEIPELSVEQRERIIVNKKEIIEVIKKVPSIVFSFVEPLTRKLELWIADIQDDRPHARVEGDLRSLLYQSEIYKEIEMLVGGFIITDKNKVQFFLATPFRVSIFNDMLKISGTEELYSDLCQRYKLAGIIGELGYKNFRTLPMDVE